MAAPWRWRTGWLNRRDDKIDDGSSSGTVDQGRRGVAVDDIVGEEALDGWRTEEGMGLAGFPDLGVRMGGRMGWEWGTMAYGRACLKCGVSYESTPTDLRWFF